MVSAADYVSIFNTVCTIPFALAFYVRSRLHSFCETTGGRVATKRILASVFVSVDGPIDKASARGIWFSSLTYWLAANADGIILAVVVCVDCFLDHRPQPTCSIRRLFEVERLVDLFAARFRVDLGSIFAPALAPFDLLIGYVVVSLLLLFVHRCRSLIAFY